MSSIDSQECDWFPKEFQRNWARVWLFLFMDSKGLTMHLIDFQKNFWGFSKKHDRFSQGFGKDSKGFDNEFNWFPKKFWRIWQEYDYFQKNFKGSDKELIDFQMDASELTMNLIDF